MNIFPKWMNQLPIYFVMGLGFTTVFTIFVFWYWFSPKNLDVGYAPKQPIAYSHKTHVSQLGIDCRYCHEGVEVSAKASLPATETCMGCHKVVRKSSKNTPGLDGAMEIQKIVDHYENDKPIEWVKVHFIPDYAYFNHSIHINAGVSCVSCHGRIDQMEVVYQAKPLSMSWCLDCHRNPEPHLRPSEFITKMDWKPTSRDLPNNASSASVDTNQKSRIKKIISDKEALIKIGSHIREMKNIQPRQDCSTCHR